MAELKTEIADLKEEIKGHNNHLKVATSVLPYTSAFLEQEHDDMMRRDENVPITSTIQSPPSSPPGLLDDSLASCLVLSSPYNSSSITLHLLRFFNFYHFCLATTLATLFSSSSTSQQTIERS
eukprot:scaffold1881_cov181-Ochromonas_danica.AAC.6